MQVGWAKNRDSRPTSSFIACCQLCDRQVLYIRTAAPEGSIARPVYRAILAVQDEVFHSTQELARENVVPHLSEIYISPNLCVDLFIAPSVSSA